MKGVGEGSEGDTEEREMKGTLLERERERERERKRKGERDR